MKRSSTALLTAACVVPLLVGAPAKAGQIGWSYSWDRTPIAVSADAPGTGGITLTNELVHNASGSTDISATNLRTFSSADPRTPDTFTNRPYTLTLTLTDDASKESGTLTFTGEFNGTLSVSNSEIRNTFTGKTDQVLSLGGHTYTVTIGPYVPPGPPSASNAGSIGAFVTVDGNNGPPPVNETPEPSTLVLSCLGLSCLGLATWRKRRSSAALRLA